MKHDKFGEAGDYTEPRRKLHPIAERLRKRRYDLGVSQTVLAEKMGYDVKTLKAWEQGVNIPKVEAIEVWAQALGLRLELTDD